MKKLLAIAFVGGLIMASCAKKESVDETNTMMTEPDSITTPMMDSTAMMPADSAAVVAPTVTDSTAVVQ
ncbi:hypothetical protein MVI27_06825 [Chryseobacterium salipaludis]|uniref:hypothetical protein n=1 Tax=Chryseobacterium TaxID=59732 RepID=UPI001FF32B17|nr:MULTISPECIES: hypothetical protein [Chryseobacterium]MCJ8497969.1 hypothetical protein [Chryseobacterium salipaludis]MCX3296832.1 hypothetical protein [Planobacterium sp. JC490]